MRGWRTSLTIALALASLLAACGASSAHEAAPSDARSPRSNRNDPPVGPVATAPVPEETILGWVDRATEPRPEAPPYEPPPDTLAGYVRAQVRAHRPELRRCYERALAESPGLRGRLAIRFTIQPDGSLTDVEVRDDELGSDALAECVVAVVRAWTMPPELSSVRRATVTYPLVFQPGEG